MTVGPLGLMTAPPITVIVLIYTILHLEGSFSQLLEKFYNEGFLNAFINMHPSVDEMLSAMKYVFAFMLLELLFMPLLPGKMYVGPVAPSGHRPTYKANGVQAFLATAAAWAAGSYLGLFKAGILFEIALPMFAGLNIMSIFVCLCLYLKGLLAPSTPDHGPPVPRAGEQARSRFPVCLRLAGLRARGRAAGRSADARARRPPRALGSMPRSPLCSPGTSEVARTTPSPSPSTPFSRAH